MSARPSSCRHRGTASTSAGLGRRSTGQWCVAAVCRSPATYSNMQNSRHRHTMNMQIQAADKRRKHCRVRSASRQLFTTKCVNRRCYLVCLQVVSCDRRHDEVDCILQCGEQSHFRLRRNNHETSYQFSRWWSWHRRFTSHCGFSHVAHLSRSKSIS